MWKRDILCLFIFIIHFIVCPDKNICELKQVWEKGERKKVGWGVRDNNNNNNNNHDNSEETKQKQTKKKTWEASRVLSKTTISWIGKGHTKHMYLVFSKLENIAVLLNCWNNSSTFMGNILQERREKETFVCCCFIFLPVSSNYNRSRENSMGTPDSNNNNNHYSFDLSRGFLKEDNKKNEKQVLKHLLFCLIFIAISVVTWVQQQCANFGI